MTGTLAAPTASISERPERVWKALAPLLSAPGRRTMRVYNADTGKFSDNARLTMSLPSRPAAPYLYTTAGRTHMIGLDFDDKRGGRAAVDADLATAAEWIVRCGGVIVTDHSPTGRHLLVPLAIGTTASATEMTHLVRLLGARLPTLDITPNTNAASGCLSAPGTPLKTGVGYRQLDGPLAAAVNAFTTRSAPSLLPRLYELLGALKPRTRTDDVPAQDGQSPQIGAGAFCTGQGDQQCLAPAYVRDDPMHPDITAYAQRGVMPTGQRQWASHSEARQSVLTAAIARGHSLATITTLMAPGGPWQHGLGQAYSRYGHAAGKALHRDFHRALDWLCTNTLQCRPPQHESKYTQGGNNPTGFRGPESLRVWLTNALAWADREYAGKRYRWTVHAVLQTLAWHAYTAGEQITGTWVVAVGGRSLSLGTGLLSEDAVWRVLRDLRDRPGAPLILTRRGAGVEADAYALTVQNTVAGTAITADRVRVEPVHDAWSVAGHHLRRIYELIAYHGLTSRSDVYAAAAVSRTAGDEAVIALEVLGLIRRTGRGTVAVGAVTLADLATAHQTDDVREERITRYRTERSQWRQWLDSRDQARTEAEMTALDQLKPFEHADVDRTFWDAVMANGPPPSNEIDPEREAIDLVADLLGGRIITAG
ncbi:hypothetical protein [Mycolicibacterium aubagnense]|uniref:Uncharacterized protein n=1 Tax=Mycolicibacterium aubagnense TaxID=319707 RepID=A0ABM7INB9_9MYCO|nr:hypothetical protein [Mycolicibacterium aubagnense]TLH49055.1 hypothetical protein C1S80_28980 [Mycolicibacterium aubagnense]BBX88217.1 hypothetical protein MAUB_64180 [Mycolicibacterium aubagnense]